MKKTLTSVARATAIRAHEGQLYGDSPYRVHLEAVVEVLERFGIQSAPILAAGWLHDVVEDTGTTLESLRATLKDHDILDVEAALAILNACTDGSGENRKARKERPYRLIPQTEGAILVKLADRIANTEASLARADSKRIAMYRKEYTFFRARLFGHGGDIALDMWTHLDSLVERER